MLDVMTLQAPGRCQIFFNISGNVGLNSPNDGIDVQLVQLGYACAAVNPMNTAPADVKAVWAKVLPGAQYSKAPTDPLSQAIGAHQRWKKSLADGHISRMKGGTSAYPGPKGQEVFLLAALCNNISDVLASVFPRIDLDRRCPAQLAAHIKQLLRN